jgi:hypothetical protein
LCYQTSQGVWEFEGFRKILINARIRVGKYLKFFWPRNYLINSNPENPALNPLYISSEMLLFLQILVLIRTIKGFFSIKWSNFHVRKKHCKCTWFQWKFFLVVFFVENMREPKFLKSTTRSLYLRRIYSVDDTPKINTELWFLDR